MADSLTDALEELDDFAFAWSVGVDDERDVAVVAKADIDQFIDAAIERLAARARRRWEGGWEGTVLVDGVPIGGPGDDGGRGRVITLRLTPRSEEESGSISLDISAEGADDVGRT